MTWLLGRPSLSYEQKVSVRQRGGNKPAHVLGGKGGGGPLPSFGGGRKNHDSPSSTWGPLGDDSQARSSFNRDKMKVAERRFSMLPLLRERSLQPVEEERGGTCFWASGQLKSPHRKKKDNVTQDRGGSSLRQRGKISPLPCAS